MQGKMEETTMCEEKPDCRRPERVRAEPRCSRGICTAVQNSSFERWRCRLRCTGPNRVARHTLLAVGQPAKDGARTDEEETYCRQPPPTQNTRMHRRSANRQ